MTKFKISLPKGNYEVPPLERPLEVRRPLLVTELSPPQVLPEVSKSGIEIPSQHMQITPILSSKKEAKFLNLDRKPVDQNESIPSSVLYSFAPGFALLEGRASALVLFGSLVMLGMVHGGSQGGFLAWLKKLWPWGRQKTEPKLLPPPAPLPQEALYRDPEHIYIDLSVAEGTREKVRMALKQGGVAKPSPHFGTKYLELIVDLRTGDLIPRKSVSPPPPLKVRPQGGVSVLSYLISPFGALLGYFARKQMDEFTAAESIRKEVEGHMMDFPLAGEGWTSLTITLDDLAHGKINLPDWEVARLGKLLHQEGLSPAQRGMIKGLIDLDEVKSSPAIDGPYRGISDPSVDLVEQTPASNEAWGRIEKFLRVWGWGKYRQKEALIDYLFSPAGRRSFESYMELGRINPHYPLPVYILATGGEGYHYAALGMLQVLLRNSESVDQLKDNIKRFGKYQNQFNLYLYEISDFAVDSFMNQTGLKPSEGLRFALKDALIGLMYDRFEAWFVDHTVFGGKATKEFLDEVKRNDRRFEIKLDEEGEFTVEFNKVSENSSSNSEAQRLSTAKAMKEILRLLMNYPDPRVQEEARRIYYADFERF